MSKVVIVVRILLGLMLTIFGLNGFLQFMPMPEMAPEAGELLGALMKAGYFFPIIAVVEVIVGVLLLVNRFVALALVVVFPILLNAFLFHLFLDLPGIGGAAFCTVLTIVLMVLNIDQYKSLLVSK